MESVDITTTLGELRIEYDPSLLAGGRKDHVREHDKFFEPFSRVWVQLINRGLHKDAERVWDKTLEIVYAYEAEHKNSIHKGTPYYFWGGTCILNGDLDMGFHLMHQALNEDKKNSEATGDKEGFKKTPSYAFVKLDYKNQNQFFLYEVEKAATFVSATLRCYRIYRGGTLEIDNLRSRVLENNGLGDVPFFLVYNFFRLKKLLDAKMEIRQNDFASLLQMQTILGFCIVAEVLFKKAMGENKKSWPVWLYRFAANNKISLPNLSQNGKDESSKEAIKINREFRDNF